ncbi:E3 ubiquitin-protein ligase Zswim2 [Rhizoclosmatium sp. JEL0117]|nr:E3 ubiquitin-protein ligase Zswim2 [Rhizoclosmatium sp. JEL0117]
MIKVFRISPENEMLYQNSLIEREIIELMESRKKKNPIATSVTEEKETEAPLEKGTVRQRPIEEGDICPICMEDLDVRTGAITYCKLSCGNNLHVKCMKVLMDHQTKNMGLENVKCPLCRKDFGKYEELKKELAEGFSHHIKIENQSRHYGVSCSECSETPIFGKCHRELTADDYETLLTLGDPLHQEHEQPTPSGRTPLHIISTFPTRTITYGDPLLRATVIPTPSSYGSPSVLPMKPKCDVCLASYTPGDIVRIIPCRHSFHQNCVDRWLLMQKSTCPTCYAPAFLEIRDGVGGSTEIDMNGRMEEPNFKVVPFRADVIGVLGTGQKKVGKSQMKEAAQGVELGTQDHGMVIVGTGSTSTPPTLSNPSKSKTQRKPKTGPTKTRPTKLPPLFANLRKNHSETSLLGPPQATLPPRLSTAKAQWEAASSRMSLFSTSANSVQDLSPDPLLFDDLIISRSLRRGGPATAAESETGVVPPSSSKPAGPSAFKTSLQKRRFLPHTNLSVIEKGPVNLDSLVECHKYKLQQVVQRHGGIVLPQSPVEAVSGEVTGVGQVIVSRASIGSRRSVLPKIQSGNLELSE